MQLNLSYNMKLDIDIRYEDTYNIINKLKSNNFIDYNNFKTVMHAYKLMLLQKDEKLSIENFLKSRIDIMPHQIYAALKVKNEFGGRVILADEVGLGKTIEAGIIIKEYIARGLANSILILCPATLVTQWKGEMLNKFDLDFVTNKDKHFAGYNTHDKLIISLDKAKRVEELLGREWDMVVIDEAHRLKNRNSRNYKFVKALQNKYLILLTATPIQNNLLELYNLVELVKPGLLISQSYFQSRYTLDNKARSLNPNTRTELQDLLSQCIIRARREEVKAYLKFSKRIPHTYRQKLTENEKRLYNELTEYLSGKYSYLIKTKAPKVTVFSLINIQKQLASSTKALVRALERRIQNYGVENLEHFISLAEKVEEDTKASILKDIVRRHDNDKYLIFTEYRATQDYISECLNDIGIETVIFNGSMSVQEKDMAVFMFKNDVNVMISTDSGSEGRNFQFCNNIINYDLSWNPMRIEQRIGRLHRIGQEKDVHIYNLVAEDTIEDYILSLIYEKLQLFLLTIGDLDLIIGDLDLVEKIGEIALASSNREEQKNKFSALSKELLKREKIAEAIKEFDDNVLSTLDLSPLNDTEEYI